MVPLPMECLVEVEAAAAAAGDAPSRTPVYRNAACDPHLPLASVWEGKSTLLETFESTASKNPNKPFLGSRPKDAAGNVARSYQWQTYWEASLLVQWLAKSLFALGVRPGARVGILGPNTPQWVHAMLACSKASAVCTPLYPTFGPEAMTHVISHSGMGSVFVHSGNLGSLVAAMQRAAGQGQAARQQASSSGGGAAAAAAAPQRQGGGAEPGPGHCIRFLVVWGVETISHDIQQACSALHVQVLPWDEFMQTWDKEEHRKIDFELVLTPPAPEDLCTIMYTSGTTGPPKGVMITHRAIVSVIASQLAFLNDPWSRVKLAAQQQQQQQQQQASGAEPGAAPQPAGSSETEQLGLPAHFPRFALGEDAHLSYLPLAHIYERVLIEAAIALGAKVGFWQGSIAKLQDDAALLRPAMMIGVPRVWERVRESTWEKLNARTPISRFLFRWFTRIKLGRLKAGAPQCRAFWLGDFLIFRKVKAALGGRLKLAVSGAASLSPEAEEFMRVSLGCLAGQGYGLTESCSATCVAWPDRWDMFGTVGPVQSCVEFRLAAVPEMGYDALPSSPEQLPRGEICLRGPCLFSGYYRDECATRDVMDDEGFFHTGDIAQLEHSGALRIIDRKKNLIKLQQGEYVAVERVEAVLRDCPSIAQAWVYAEQGGRRLLALVVPRFKSLLAWAQAEGLTDMAASTGASTSTASLQGSSASGPGQVELEERGGGGVEAGPMDETAGGMQPELSAGERRRLAAVCTLPAARREVLREAREASERAGLAGFEQVYAVRLIPYEWTPANQLLTPTHKLRRHELRRLFQAEINDMVAELGSS